MAETIADWIVASGAVHNWFEPLGLFEDELRRTEMEGYRSGLLWNNRASPTLKPRKSALRTTHAGKILGTCKDTIERTPYLSAQLQAHNGDIVP